MSKVTSWTEAEISVLVQAWSEVEAKYPTLRCHSGTGTLHSKMYAVFSRRSTFARSSNAVVHTKNAIRTFVLFVVKHDKERQKNGGRLWFDLSAEERKRLRKLIPRRARGLMTALGQEAFAKLLKMERVQRWLGGDAVHADLEQKSEAHDIRPESSFLSSTQPESIEVKPSARRSLSSARVDGSSPLSEANTVSIEQDAEKWEDRLSIPMRERSDSNTCSMNSEPEDDESPMVSACKSPPAELFTFPTIPKTEGKTKAAMKLKHWDCNILIDNMMKLQNNKVCRAVRELRADIEGEVQRSSEMLRSIISNQFEDPESSGDVAFVSKVLMMQQQQVHDRFDQFEETRAREEAANRGLLGKRYNS